jgi:hypothetical protein
LSESEDRMPYTGVRVVADRAFQIVHGYWGTLRTPGIGFITDRPGLLKNTSAECKMSAGSNGNNHA